MGLNPFTKKPAPPTVVVKIEAPGLEAAINGFAKELARIATVFEKIHKYRQPTSIVWRVGTPQPEKK